MQFDEPFKTSFFVNVYGLDGDARHMFREHFPSSTGGVHPSTLIPCNSACSEPDQIDRHVVWIQDSLKGRYQSIRILVSVQSPVCWADVLVPQEVLAAVSRYGCELNVSFISPPSGAKQSA
jgi:hypothetical protein